MLCQGAQEVSGSAAKTKVDRERKEGREGKRWMRDIVHMWERRVFPGQKTIGRNQTYVRYLMRT